MEDIKRKWLPKTMPVLTGLNKESYERYYLPSDSLTQLRVQKVGERYDLEKLVSKSNLAREVQREEISKEKFDELKKTAWGTIIRDSYSISDNPEIKLRIYHGKYEGLVRIEVGFEDEKTALQFQPLDWFGREITGTPLWRDSELLKLSDEEFMKLLLRS